MQPSRQSTGEPWPERVSELHIGRKVKLGKGTMLVLIGTADRGRMYKREGDGYWYLLDDGADRERHTD